MKIPLIVFVFIVSLFVPRLQKESEIIGWSKSSPLNWSDFKGGIDVKNIHDAISTCDIFFKYRRVSDTLRLTVRCDFHKYKSWVKTEKQTKYLLKHEQGHFDIAELYTRKLRKSYSTFKFTRSNYKNELNNLYQKVNAEKLNRQTMYDAETNHSQIKNKQIEWDKRIYTELEELNAYNDSCIITLIK